VFNVWFIYGFGMHVDGVAWGTLVSTYLAVLLAFVLFLNRYRKYFSYYKHELLLNLNEIRRYFSVNRDIFIRTLCLIFTFSFFTAVSAQQGDLILAANTILLQFWFIVSYGIDGFAYAAESLVGRFKGSTEKDKLKKAVLYNTGWGLLLGVSGTLVYALFGDQLLLVFTDKQEVIDVAKSVLFWTVTAPLVSSFCYIFDGVYIGATETKTMRNTMVFSTFIVFLPIYYLATDFFGKHGLWIAMVLFMVTRGVALGIFLPKTVLKT